MAILMAFKFCNVIGISCTYGNCPQQMVLKNVIRLISVYKFQNPSFKLPSLCLSASDSISKKQMKSMTETDFDCFHGKDGLGDVPDFEQQN
jgi:inosine-uridine nucleoside N-ribohydrolase